MATALADRVRAALSHPYKIVECTRDELEATGTWNPYGRHAKVEVDGQIVRVIEQHNSSTGATTYVAGVRRQRQTVFDDVEILTTPEEDFGASARKRGTNEPA